MKRARRELPGLQFKASFVPHEIKIALHVCENRSTFNQHEQDMSIRVQTTQHRKGITLLPRIISEFTFFSTFANINWIERGASECCHYMDFPEVMSLKIYR